MDTHAVIVAGGRGERMKVLGAALPKPMLPVLGKPVLEHQLLWLKKAGFAQAHLCLGHKAQAVRGYFKDGSRWDLRLAYSVEEEPLGTAGSVRRLGPGLRGDILVLYGDIYVDMDPAPLLRFHGSHDGLATLAVRVSDHPQDSDLVVLDEAGRITGFPGKPVPGKPFVNLTCAALWVLRHPILDLVPEGRPTDWAKDIFPMALSKGMKLMGYKTDEMLADIGTPERYEALKKRLSPPTRSLPRRGSSR